MSIDGFTDCPAYFVHTKALRDLLPKISDVVKDDDALEHEIIYCSLPGENLGVVTEVKDTMKPSNPTLSDGEEFDNPCYVSESFGRVKRLSECSNSTTASREDKAIYMNYKYTQKHVQLV